MGLFLLSPFVLMPLGLRLASSDHTGPEAPALRPLAQLAPALAIAAAVPHHPEDGEESFIVTRDEDGSVDVTVTAVWRPATVANSVFPPLTRFLQNRVINQYLDGIATVTEQVAPKAATAASSEGIPVTAIPARRQERE